MDETSNPGQAPAPPKQGTEKVHVGEILRNERERRGVSIFAIAKDLRLNPKFIEALETDDYDLLPGDTYIRVYLRSLCKYFSLNADELLERFFKERGVSGVDTLRKDSSTKINLVALREKEKPNKTVILAASAFIVLALILFIAAQQGWFSTRAGAKTDSLIMKNQPGDSSSSGQSMGGPDASATDSFAYDSSGSNMGSPENGATSRDTIPLPTVKKESRRDSLRNAKARKKFIKDSIHQAEAMVKFAKDSVFKAEARNKFAKDSVLKAEAKSKTAKDSLLKADAKNRSGKDSVLQAEAKSKATKDSILKAEAKNKIIQDSILKAGAKSKVVKDSLLNAEAKTKMLLDEIAKAQAKAKAIKDSTLKAEAKNKALKDSAQKAETKNWAVKDSAAKTEAKNKAAKDSVKKAEVKNKTITKDTLKIKGAASDVSKSTSESGGPLELKIEVTGNSAWARVLSDGVPWRNIMRKGSVSSFAAKDSFNLRTGQLEDLTITLNGKRLNVPSEGIIALRIDRSGITVWSDDQWFKLTKGRF